MADLNWIIKIMKENPTETAIGIGATAKIGNSLILDPYANCGFLMTMLQVLFTFGVFIYVPYLLDQMVWQSVMDWGVAFLTKVVALGVSIVGLIALIKKTFRAKRRSKVNAARRKKTNL
jgi:hypothetical protein